MDFAVKITEEGNWKYINRKKYIFCGLVEGMMTMNNPKKSCVLCRK